MNVNITTGLLPSYMKLSIMTRAVTPIHHTHDENDTLAVYCSDCAAAGSSPEPDPDPELIEVTSGLERRDGAASRTLPQGQVQDGI